MVSAILLAAGESRRMGERNKLLLPFQNETIIVHILKTLSATDAGELIVVLGHQAEQVKNLLSEPAVKFVINKVYQQGMTTSIHAGVLAASADADGLMICLSDLPFIEVSEFNQLIHFFQKAVQNNHRQILVPAVNGKRGNPVIFSAFYRTQILEHKGLMGCKGIVKQNPEQVLEVEMTSQHVLMDIDTMKDYNDALQKL